MELAEHTLRHRPITDVQTVGVITRVRAAAALWLEGVWSMAVFLGGKAWSGWLYLVQHQASPLLGRRQRRLRISETVSLGEKRSVAILEVDGQAFLVGSSGNTISLLATIDRDTQNFHEVLSASFHRGEAQ